MRCVCPQDVKHMLLQRAGTDYWKKWAAKHEIEELREGVWLELAVALLRKKTKGDWTKTVRCWSNELSVKLVTKKRAQQSTRSAIVQYGKGSEGRSQRLSESGSKKRGLQRKSGTGKEVCIVAHPLSESQWNRGYSSMKQWESEKHKNW